MWLSFATALPGLLRMRLVFVEKRSNLILRSDA
jgi:hypothetical protein